MEGEFDWKITIGLNVARGFDINHRTRKMRKQKQKARFFTFKAVMISVYFFL